MVVNVGKAQSVLAVLAPQVAIYRIPFIQAVQLIRRIHAKAANPHRIGSMKQARRHGRMLPTVLPAGQERFVTTALARQVVIREPSRQLVR